MQARSVCKGLLETLADKKEYPVHSRFASGFNLRVDKYLAFAGNKLGERLPLGILLDPADLRRIPEWIRPGETVFIWDAARKRFWTRGMSLCLEASQPFESAPGTPFQIGAEACKLFDRAVDPGLTTGLGATVGMLSDMGWSATEELCGCFGTRDPARAEAALKKWVGRGLGLTPSGDDFLTGTLLVDALCPFLSEAFRQALEALLDAGYTTDMGASCCRLALRGLFCGSLLDLGDALRRGGGMAESLDRVLRFGHTSGRDMAAGIRLGLLQAARREQKSA